MHVVIIDPSRVVQAKIAAELEASGSYVDCFSSSDLALRHIEAHRSVDVVLTSLELEPISGLELCWTLRLVAGEKRPLHIIAMSSNTSERALSEALDCGADDFILKPVGREELRARLRAANRLMTLQRELITQAQTDPLTGLLNRRAFSELMTERRSELDKTDNFAVCVCELDDCKLINTKYGPDAGDSALKLVAQLAVEEAPIVARLGGVEFGLGFPVLDAAEAARWCDVIRQNVAKSTIESARGSFNFTCTFGVSEWLPDESVESALTRAKAALVEAQARGHSGTEVSNTLMPAA